MTSFDSISQEQTRKFIQDDPQAFAKILLERIVPEVKDLLSALNETNECKQFEICLMDIQSMQDHLGDYLANGPEAPFVKVDLKDSEIPADAPENQIPGLSLVE